VVAAPIAVAILIIGGAPLAALLAITAAIGAWEFNRIAQAAGLCSMDDAGFVVGGLADSFPSSSSRATSAFTTPMRRPDRCRWRSSSCSRSWPSRFGREGVAGKPLGSVAVTVLGAVYTGGTLSYAYAIRDHEYAFAPANLSLFGRVMTVPSGGLLLLLPVLLTWASDTGAYAFGRMFGRHKLIPAVSPGKTVEGAIGGLIAAMLVAWGYSNGILRPASHLAFRGSPAGVLAFGAAVSIAAQVEISSNPCSSEKRASKTARTSFRATVESSTAVTVCSSFCRVIHAARRHADVGAMTNAPNGTRRGVAILGSTGSIGTTALRVLARQSERFRVSALTAFSNAALLEEQVSKFAPSFVGIVQNGAERIRGGASGRSVSSRPRAGTTSTSCSTPSSAPLVFRRRLQRSVRASALRSRTRRRW